MLTALVCLLNAQATVSAVPEGEGESPPIGHIQFIAQDGVGFWQRYPIVTARGASGAVQVGLTSNIGPGGFVTLHASLQCWNANLAQIDREFAAKTVWVPPDPSTPPNGTTAQRTVTMRVSTPTECVPRAEINGYNVDVRFTVHIAVPGNEPWGSTFGFGQIGKSFTRRNIRPNLDLRQNISDRKMKRYQAHHTMPHKYRSWFTNRGFDIDDPAYLRWWCSKPGVRGNHGSMAPDYNRRWRGFIDDHPRASRKQILRFRNQVQKVKKYRYVCPGDRLPPAPKPYWRSAVR